jgi:uncharacterized protein with GYD domain
MPKYMLKVSYEAEGVRGVVKEGGTARMNAARALIESLGGSMESFYFALGSADAFVIVDAPDLNAVLASSMAVNASGAVKATLVPLVTPAEIDAAAKTSTAAYRPPRG